MEIFVVYYGAGDGEIVAGSASVGDILSEDGYKTIIGPSGGEVEYPGLVVGESDLSDFIEVLENGRKSILLSELRAQKLVDIVNLVLIDRP